MADKKAVPLRISEKLYSDLAAWAEDDFRSLNGQIEYLLTECVRQRKKNGGYGGLMREIDKPLEVDLSDTTNAKKTDRD
ncbi:MAG: PTS ascorbate transporter subunit IIC [Oscillospiraceae bacterium]|nr:PTS ascorbate transporter subunit IIC [Oscillospiraceae bacterium]